MKIRLTPEDLHRFAQATRPNQVGQVSDLIRECPAQDYEGWRDWYLARYPTATDEGTDRIVSMLKRMRDAMEHIDRETVRRWVQSLYWSRRMLACALSE